MTSVDQLINRFVEDPGASSPEQLDELIAALREEPTKAVRLREQLMLDDLLAQKLTVDRRNFLAQVEQRIADYERGQDEIDNQVSALGAIAETELERPNPRRGTSLGMNLLLVAAAAALIAGVFIAPGLLQQGKAIARVEAIQGEAKVVRGDSEVLLKVGDAILTEKTLRVADGSSLVLVYADRTRIEVAGGSFALSSNPTTRAKQVLLESGELTANVAKQSAGPMLFNTPHAVATVLGTEFRLTVEPKATRLDVTEGSVQFATTDGAATTVVAAHETGEVRDEQLIPARSLTWPDDRSATVFLFERADERTLVRNPESPTFLDTPLEAQGSVGFGGSQELELSGGSFTTVDGGNDISTICKRTPELTFETVVSPRRERATGSIAALAFAGERGNFELAQEKDQLVFRLQTDGKSEGVEKIGLGKVEADRPTHVTVTYRDGALVAFINGQEVARRNDVSGGFSGWAQGALTIGSNATGGRSWRGSVAGLAIYNRALEPAEVNRNARNFRNLHASAARQSHWTNLMTDAGPSAHAVAGTWEVVDDAWQSAGSDERLALGPVKGSYHLRFELHMLQSTGQPIELLLPVGHRKVSAVLQTVGSAAKFNGLDLVDLRPTSENASGIPDRQLDLQRIYTIDVRVRDAKDKASVSVLVDDEPWVEWVGPRESLSLSTERQDWAREGTPVLSVGNNRVQVHSLKLRELK
jgi:ferric-dicitrate binding protein FerR (iron transport regulator)